MSQTILMQKIRREAIRWHLLTVVDLARPYGMYTEALLPIIRSVYPDATHQEIRRELDYLEERECVHIKKDGMERWCVELARIGIEIVDYTIDCQPGISRPSLTRE